MSSPADGPVSLSIRLRMPYGNEAYNGTGPVAGETRRRPHPRLNAKGHRLTADGEPQASTSLPDDGGALCRQGGAAWPDVPLRDRARRWHRGSHDAAAAKL